MKLPVRLYRKRSWAVVVLATLTGCFAMHSGSGETLLPEAGAPSSPPPADSGAVRDKTAMLFITSRDANAILGFPATAKGNVPPSVDITGDKTGLSEPIALGVDPTSGKIYAANDPGSTILIFPKGANGNVAPKTLGGSKVPIQATEGIAVDSHGEIYVSDYKANAIYVFAAGANGNTAPIRTIAGSKTLLNEPVGMSFDSKGNLYVANPYNFGLPIEEFAKDADGNVAPIAVLRGKHTKIVHDFGNVSVDKHDRIVVACEDSILVFAPGAHGNVEAAENHQKERRPRSTTPTRSGPMPARIFTRPISTLRRTYRQYSSLRRMQRGTRHRCACSPAPTPTSTTRTTRRSTDRHFRP